jgi:hypothetical protein
MQLRHNLPLLLLVGWGLVDVAVLVTFLALDLAGRSGAVPWDPVFVTLVSMQGSVVAAWFYLSDQWPGWHALSLLILVVTLAACGPQPLTTSLIIVFHLLVMAIVHLPLGILRDRGWRYRFHATSIEERRPWQFSLGELLGFTVTVALCLGLWQLIRWLKLSTAFQLLGGWPDWVLGLALIPWLPAIRVLAGLVQSRYIQAIALVLGVVHLRLLIDLPSFDRRSASITFAVIVAGAVALIAHATALRWAGWRIERDPRQRIGQAPRRPPEPVNPNAADAVHGESGSPTR